MTRPVGIGFVGLGARGLRLARAAGDLPAGEVRSLCDRDPAARLVAKKRHLGVPVVPDVDGQLCDESVDAIVVATPASTHYNLSRRCLIAEKHVLILEPVALEQRAAEELMLLAARKDRRLMIGQLLPFHPAIRKIKELIELENFAEIRYVAANRRAFPDGVAKNTIFTLAASEISAFIYLLADEPLEVTASGVNGKRSEVVDALHCRLDFPRGVMCRLDLSLLEGRGGHELTVVGSQATAVFEDGESAGRLTIYQREGDTVSARLPADDPLHAELDYFLSAITLTPSVPSRRPDALTVARVVDAIERSLDTGTTQVLYPASRVSVG